VNIPETFQRVKRRHG